MGDYLCPKCNSIGVRAGRMASCVRCRKLALKAKRQTPKYREQLAAFTARLKADPVRYARLLERKRADYWRNYDRDRKASRRKTRRRSAERESAQPVNPRAKVYFVQDTDRGLIKIGFTTKEMRSRLKELQCGNPSPLSLLATVNGTRLSEKLLHDRFEHAHHRGEWFRPVPELLAHIASLTASALAAA